MLFSDFSNSAVITAWAVSMVSGGCKFTTYPSVATLPTIILLTISMIFLPILWSLFPN